MECLKQQHQQQNSTTFRVNQHPCATKNQLFSNKIMKAELEYPIKSLRGNIGSEYYTRVMNGKQIVQRRPKRTKPATEAQQRARKEFAAKYAVRKDRRS